MNAKGMLAVAVGVVVTAGLVLVGSGTALAAGTNAVRGAAVSPACGGPGGGGAGVSLDVLTAAANYLQLPVADVRSALKAGTSLAALAAKQGKTVAGLQAALHTAYKARLDAKVAAGTLTADQETQLLTSFDAKVTTLVNGTGLNALRAFSRRR